MQAAQSVRKMEVNMSAQSLKSIIIRGLKQNNLKNVSLDIPKEKIVVFTGVSGSGKSSIVFDTIAAESQRQIKETYPSFIRGRLPKYEKPHADKIENLTPSVIVDQSRLGGNARSTVGTITDLYAQMRLLFSRIGKPVIGTSSYFSFNNPNGMCKYCSGLGKVTQIDMDLILDKDKSWNEGMVDFTVFKAGGWYWKQYAGSKLFDVDKPFRELSQKEKNIILYGTYEKGGKQINPKVEGVKNYLNRTLLNKDRSGSSDNIQKRIESYIKREECPCCHGKRLSERALSCKIDGYDISQLCNMEFTQLYEFLKNITDSRVSTIVETMRATLSRMIEIGLPYLNLNRETSSLSGGEAQRLKLVRYMGSSLTGMTYIFDEPGTGMHPRDVHRMSRLLVSLRDKGNTVLVVEHDKDIIKIADEIIDVGPLAGKDGGQIVFQGSYEQLLLSGTVTGNAMSKVIPVKKSVRKPSGFLPVRNASAHNLKNVNVDIPLGVLTVVTGVAGSGKSSLIRNVFAEKYKDQVVLIDQAPITANGNSTPATYLGFANEIRKIMAEENNIDAAYFSFNSKGACPCCKGKGVIVTELAFMDPMVTVCEECEGKRYSKEAESFKYKGKNITEILNMTVQEAVLFFEGNKKILKKLNAMMETGLSYLSLGQPLSTLSGGERQRLKLASHLDKKGNIYVLDEPTTGLHASDTGKVMSLLNTLIERGNTVIVIEHNTDVMKLGDYIIDVGPDGGNAGGEVVFTGTPEQLVEQGTTITAKYLRKQI